MSGERFYRGCPDCRRPVAWRSLLGGKEVPVCSSHGDLRRWGVYDTLDGRCVQRASVEDDHVWEAHRRAIKLRSCRKRRARLRAAWLSVS